MPLVNVITDTEPAIFESQEPVSEYQYKYSSSPSDADWHVVLGITRPLVIPNSAKRCFFVATEPPEIERYDVRVLAGYGQVLSAPFRYLHMLANLVQEVGLLPWRVGITIEGQTITVNEPRATLQIDREPTEDTVSVVTSQKAITSAQQERLRLIDFLSQRIPEMRVYGRGANTVGDKADALRVSRFHIALENCRQPGFWTEKLADPLLMQNVVFYGGHNQWQHIFAADGAIIEIDAGRRMATYELIRQVLDSDPYERLRPYVRENKRLVLDRYNLHAAIERAIARVPTLEAVTGPIEFPQHMSWRRRLQSRLPAVGRHRLANKAL